MHPKQEALDFPDEPRGPPKAEPSRPAQVMAAGNQYLPLLRRAHAVVAAR
jgi:hypothetical protein